MYPGKVLAEIYRAEMDLNRSAQARRCGCTSYNINEVVNINETVNGKRGNSPSFSLVLGKVRGTSAEMWVRLRVRMEADFDL